MIYHCNKKMIFICLLLSALVVFTGCQPSKPEPRQTVVIPDGEINPELWGKAYNEEYELWKKTESPVGARLSKYKTGMD